jgi:hypothetical protein
MAPPLGGRLIAFPIGCQASAAASSLNTLSHFAISRLGSIPRRSDISCRAAGIRSAGVPSPSAINLVIANIAGAPTSARLTRLANI